MAAAFGAYLVDGHNPEPNFSVRFEDPSQDDEGVRPFQILYKSDCQAIRTTHRSRVIGALRTSVARHAGEGRGLFRLRQVMLLTDGRAILLPPDLLPRIEGIEDRLRDQGIEVLDPGFVRLDPDTGEAVMPEPALRLNDEALREVGLDALPAREPARYPVGHWAILRRDVDARLRRLDVFGALMPSIEEEADLPMQRAMKAVGTALSGASVSSIWPQGSEALLRSLVEIAERG